MWRYRYYWEDNVIDYVLTFYETEENVNHRVKHLKDNTNIATKSLYVQPP